MDQTDFGFRTVTAAEKTKLVRGVFDSVANRYDLMNDAMSLGIHRLWKKEFIAALAPRPGETFLDVAGGTGDIAFGIHKTLQNRPDLAALSPVNGNTITVCDINESMLSVGRDRAIDRGWLSGFDWVVGNAESLPFPDNSFDCYSIAFGLRNVTDKDAALREVIRVLKPGGRFFCLEFSHVTVPGFDRLYDRWSFHMIPRLGKLLAGNRDSYQYLVESIRQFPNQARFAEMLRDHGLSRVQVQNLSAGIAAIHCGYKGNNTP